MLKLLLDVNFDQRILRGLRLRLPLLDFVIAQQIGLGRAADPRVLEWAAQERRVLLTHDVNTIPKFANERLQQGLPLAGVVIVPEQMEIGAAIEDLEMLIECNSPADLENQLQYLPL